MILEIILEYYFVTPGWVYITRFTVLSQKCKFLDLSEKEKT